MFTGIIRELGKLVTNKGDSKSKIFEISCKETLKNKNIGDSIAINGVCVTITKMSENSFTFEAVAETLSRTNLSFLNIGDQINLEPALSLSQSLDGHIVLGHVDTMGTVFKKSTKNKQTVLSINFPKEISQYLAFKGSVTVNGVSLTISGLHDDYFELTLIAHTLLNTNLGKLKTNDKVNIEIDPLARYVERILKEKENQSTYEFLKERNLI